MIFKKHHPSFVFNIISIPLLIILTDFIIILGNLTSIIITCLIIVFFMPAYLISLKGLNDKTKISIEMARLITLIMIFYCILLLLAWYFVFFERFLFNIDELKHLSKSVFIIYLILYTFVFAYTCYRIYNDNVRQT